MPPTSTKPRRGRPPKAPRDPQRLLKYLAADAAKRSNSFLEQAHAVAGMEPNREAYGPKNQDKYDADRAAWKQQLYVADLLAAADGVTEEMLDKHGCGAYSRHEWLIAIAFTSDIRRMCDSARITAEERRAAMTPLEREIEKRKQERLIERLAEIRNGAPPPPKVDRGTRDPVTERLNKVRTNLKNDLKSIKRHEDRLAHLAAGRVRLAELDAALKAGQAIDWEEHYRLAIEGADRGHRQTDELRQLRPKVDHWQAEIDRLEAEIGARVSPEDA